MHLVIVIIAIKKTALSVIDLFDVLTCVRTQRLNVRIRLFTHAKIPSYRYYLN